MLGFKCQ